MCANVVIMLTLMFVFVVLLNKCPISCEKCVPINDPDHVQRIILRVFVFGVFQIIAYRMIDNNEQNVHTLRDLCAVFCFHHVKHRFSIDQKSILWNLCANHVAN